MFSSKGTSQSTDVSSQISELKTLLNECDAVVIGAGAGLSTSAGFTYGGERFMRNFADFNEKYGIQDMYSGGFYPFPSPEVKWAFWSRMVMVNRYSEEPGPVYENLLKAVQGKDYFVITTNVDHCFQKAGFDKERLYYTQGDYGLFQCSIPCCKNTYDNESQIRKMVELQKDAAIPSDLLPRCPRCGAPMEMNLRCDDRFVEDLGWERARGRYEEFLFNHRKDNVLFLELGVGFNTPGIIKYPFWQMVYQNPESRYVCVNKGQAAIPKEIADRSLAMDADIGFVLGNL